MSEKACRKCRMIVTGPVCPICRRSSSLSRDWSGLVIVFDIKSEIAKKLGITKPGRYALSVR